MNCNELQMILDKYTRKFNYLNSIMDYDQLCLDTLVSTLKHEYPTIYDFECSYRMRLMLGIKRQFKKYKRNLIRMQYLQEQVKQQEIVEYYHKFEQKMLIDLIIKELYEKIKYAEDIIDVLLNLKTETEIAKKYNLTVANICYFVKKAKQFLLNQIIANEKEIF